MSIKPFSVSELTRLIKGHLEDTFQSVSVSGEISNFIHHRSGHMYFTIKDSHSEMKCIMFKGNNQFLRFQPENGMDVLLKGRISVFEQRGQYQFITNHMEPLGIGTLYLAYEALKEKLNQEGLFDEAHKISLPLIPKKVGIITSPTGAAIRDIISVFQRRSPYIPLIIRPTMVQGSGAAEDIVQAFNDLQTYGDCDLIILSRGGGSIEDLWPFNEEEVARSIHACTIPIISGVGHETDITITDLVADYRAPTPTAAAEVAAPSLDELNHTILSWFEKMTSAWVGFWQQSSLKLDALTDRLSLQIPNKQIQQKKVLFEQVTKQLMFSMDNKFNDTKQKLASYHVHLQSLNPQNILERGYSIAFKFPGRKVIKNKNQIKVGESFELLTGDGAFMAKKTKNVTKIHE